MKTLIGVDIQETYKSVLPLLARIGFEANEVTLAHVLDPTLPYPAFELMPIGTVSADYLQALQRSATSAVERAKDEACRFGMKAKAEVLTGPATPMLIDHAELTQADLVAVSASRKGALGSLFLGSTSRGLAAGAKQSVLVAKGTVAASGPLHVVLATDHSEYANRCLDRFLALRPKGVSKISAVTAYDLADYEASLLHVNIPALGARADEWINEHLQERSRQVVAKLSQNGYAADYRIAKGDANEVIRAAMAESGAELLVLGAQGHGFMDRLFLGSVSFHQVATSDYSVLIMRA